MTAEASDRYTRDAMIRAIAYLVHGLRPDWPETSVLTVLRSSSQRTDALVGIAIHAALDPTTRTPGVIEQRAPCAAMQTTTPQPPPYSGAARAAAIRRRADPDAVRVHVARLRAHLAGATTTPEDGA